MILGEVIERNERCFGSHPALLFEGRVITHGQFAARVRRLINALVGIGCKKQDRIAVLSRNCPEYLEAYGAAALGSFIAVGINYRLSVSEQVDILADAAPVVLMYEAEYASRVDELRALLPPSTHYICLGAASGWALAYEDFMAGSHEGIPDIRAEENDTLFLIYTSGTTGRPKGVKLGNAGQLEQARAQAISHCAAQTDRMLIVMPFYHIGGPTELLTYLVTGSTIVLHRTFDAHAILQSMQDSGVTAAHLAPTMIQMILEVQEKTPFDLSKLHTIIYASAPMSVALSRRARAAFGPVFMQVYGMSELGLGSVLLKHQHIIEGTPAQVSRLASAGQPYLGTEMKVVGTDGKLCAVGETGDLLMRSKAVMQGYWNRPEQTREALPADGFLRTGDMGYFDNEGFLFGPAATGRLVELLYTGGKTMSLKLKTLAATLLATANLIAGTAFAQSFPDKPVRIIVPFTAGGLADGLARGLASELSKNWPQPVVVDNRPGANTIIAAELTARSLADGYTLLLANDPTVSSNQYIYNKLPYDPVKDFTPVINIAATQEVLVASESFKSRTVADLIAQAKARPGQLTYGSYGPGSKPHLDAEDFSRTTGIRMNHIPYKGVADVMTALASGQIDVAFTGMPPTLTMVKGGKVRALAIAAPARSKLLADVPSMSEAGVAGFESSAWFGLIAPAATPKAVVDRIAADVSKIISRPDFQEKFISGVGLELLNQGPQKFAEFLVKDRAAYAQSVKNVNIKLD